MTFIYDSDCNPDFITILCDTATAHVWQFPGENITIPSDRDARLNIRGMIDYNSQYHGFCSTESITSERIADFLDRFSLTIRMDTFVILDNAKVHRSK